MPRYFFHVRDGTDYIDTVGTELLDWQAARIEAVRISGDILKNDPQRVALGEDWCIEVTDDTGLILFQMTFLVVASSAVVTQHNGRGENGPS